MDSVICAVDLPRNYLDKAMIGHEVTELDGRVAPIEVRWTNDNNGPWSKEIRGN